MRNKMIRFTWWLFSVAVFTLATVMSLMGKITKAEWCIIAMIYAVFNIIEIKINQNERKN